MCTYGFKSEFFIFYIFFKNKKIKTSAKVDQGNGMQIVSLYIFLFL